ncbi:YceI family protein [Lacinutrix jangbogonensis]|uniref:YceI family protein n=1 Tax=Lacinutrix jangbogonensis TaxID=1469557 RepID=UPI00053F052B|nr:YceI family protein [Lacinutrix jangbogonensis]
MKNILLPLALVFISLSFAQDKYLTKTGTVTFEASVPAFEEVKAKNESTTAILNTENGEFAALVLVKGFRFKNALMEEHFNENYAESDDFPKATFKGTISNFSFEKINNKPTSATFNGSLTFHGKTKAIENSTLNISMSDDNEIQLSGDFMADVSDFDIEIPSVVSKKLSKEVAVTYQFTLLKR